MRESTRFSKKTSMFLTDTSEDIDAYFRYIASKKNLRFFEADTPILTARNPCIFILFSDAYSPVLIYSISLITDPYSIIKRIWFFFNNFIVNFVNFWDISGNLYKINLKYNLATSHSRNIRLEVTSILLVSGHYKNECP